MICIRYLIIFFVLLSIDGKPQEKTVIFTDRFDNNMNNWAVDSTANVITKVSGGKYILFHNVKGDNWWSVKNIPIDAKKDFDIEVTVTSFYNQSNGFAGLIWGKEDQYYFEFSISAAGEFRIMEHKSNGLVSAWKKITFSSAIKPGFDQRNTLRIEEKKDEYHFFINDAVVCSLPYKKRPGNRIGFFVDDPHGATFDNFKVRVEKAIELEPPPKDSEFLFKEDFIQNDNNWDITSRAKIEWGAYTITTSDDSIFYTEKGIGIDGSKEFQIEALFRNIEFKKNPGYGVTWSNEKTSTDFIISPDGYFTIDRNDGKKDKTLKKWTRSNALRVGMHTQNKVTIRYKPPLYSFYINDELVFTDEHFPGNIEAVGFVVYRGQKISIDYLTVTNARADDLTPKITSLSKALIHEKDFRESDHRFVELESAIATNIEDLDLGFLEDDLDAEETDPDYLSMFIVDDSIVVNSTLSYSFIGDNLFVENKASDGIELHSYLKGLPGNFLIELQYAATVPMGSTTHGFYLGNEMTDEYEGLSLDEGSVEVSHSKGETVTILMDWKGTGQLNQNNGAMNKFSFLVLNDSCYYFINNCMIYKGNIVPFPEHLILAVSGNQKLELDYVRVYSLN